MVQPRTTVDAERVDNGGDGDLSMHNKRCSFDAAVPMLGGSGGQNRDRHYGSRDMNASGEQSQQKRRFRHRKSLMLFERASSRWWNPQFASKLLETQYWRCAFPQIRDRFRLGLVYIIVTGILWFIYRTSMYSEKWMEDLPYHLGCLAIIATAVGLLAFTFTENLYTRFYVPASFLCTFLICVSSLLFFNLSTPLISPLGMFATSIEVILLLYTVVPLPFYVCIISGVLYSGLFEILTVQNLTYEKWGVKFALHICAHLLGVHIFILHQVRNRKTFIKVGQSLLARKDIEVEREFKQRMIESVMPEKVAEELLKESTELRRPSTDSRRAKGTIFRPFTMNLMIDVSILFADIAGFTKMSSNKSADELVNLLNDLFGRFDVLCTDSGCEKISTLGDCYYCVAGCPEPNLRHAQCCVEMGLGMIVAIKDFDRERGQDVNMRVGIHTGTVMCGIVGTKRFKFDVFSNDVNLANTMESTGLAGRVHVSEATAKFLTNDYILEESEPYLEMKTYFIVGRTKENPLSSPEKDTAVMGAKLASKRVLTADGEMSLPPMLPWNNDDLRHIDSSEIESEAAAHSAGGKPTAALNLQVGGEKKKSVSLAALSSGHHPQQQTKRAQSGANSKSDSSDRQNSSIAETRRSRSPDRALVPPAETEPVNIANDLSISEHVSDRQLTMTNLFESVFEYHATSITRFDTAHTDFDQRLAQCIQESSQVSGGYLIHHRDALHKWSLKFRDSAIEGEYSAHFARSKPTERRPTSVSVVDEKFLVSPPKYSVVIDCLVATLIFVIISIVAFAVFRTDTKWIVYFSVSAAILTALITAIVVYLTQKHTLLPILSSWIPKHILGIFLIDLPLGAALLNLNCPKNEDLQQGHETKLAYQLVIAYIIIVVIFAHCNFSQLVSWTKSLVVVVVSVVFLILVMTPVCTVREAAVTSTMSTIFNGTSPLYEVSEGIATPTTTTSAYFTSTSAPSSTSFRPQIFHDIDPYNKEAIIVILLALMLVIFLNYQFETSFRLSFYGDVQAYRTIRDMQDMKDQADWLLSNIIPHHVIDYLATTQKYSVNHDQVAVIFASIVNWHEMYEETFEGGREFLRVLNELIADFDELLDRPEFAHVEKIKTIGATYMAASGLNAEKRRTAINPYSHLYQLMEFALALQNSLDNFNQDLLNFEFNMKIGYNIGPVTAGVIGTTKLYYDIWGDTVNIASRMYSTGVKGRIQVSRKAKDMLEDVYVFEYRDKIEVKGIDGGMDVYLLKGRKDNMQPRSRSGTNETDS